MKLNYTIPKLYDAGGDAAGRWYVYYKYRMPDSNEFRLFKIYISSRIKTKTGRRDKAYEIIKELKQKLSEGWNPIQYTEQQYTSIINVLDLIIDIKLSKTRKRTGYTYRNIVKRFRDYLKEKKLDKLYVSEFTKFHAQAYLDHMKLHYKYSNRTYNNHLSALRSVFNLAAEREYILRNPFSSFLYLETEEAAIIAFSNSELTYIARTLPTYNFRLWLIAELVYYCFLRPQEVVRLRFGDIDLDRRQIKLAGRQTKNKKTQVVDIPDPLVEDLQKIEWLPGNHHVFSKKLLPGTEEIAQTRIDEAWADYRKHANLSSDKTIYAMKSTGAGLLADAGVDMRSIQIQMRHHSLDETQRYLDRFRRTPNITLRQRFPKLGD